MADISFVTTAPEAAATCRRLAERIEDKKVWLLAELGQHLVEQVKERITSADAGTWKPGSKWLQAKKNTTRALVGVERYVKSSVNDNRLEVYAETPGYTLTQHHVGFANKLFKDSELSDGGRVEIEVRNPSPLGLKNATVFRFIPTNPGMTPARKIWSDDADVQKVGQPIFSRWLKNVVETTEGVRK